ncbi:MAG: ABC transporter ATP-binding protein [Acidobacteria bacterium]|nr:ABC transporter ATP-binding protein [Acidobacteriota bacterium]
MTFALEVQNLVKCFGRVRAVDDLSFSVARGSIFGLLGPNGAGKSTTLKILTTLSRPTGGSASVLGFDVVKKPLEVRRRIASVIQETAVDLLLSVRDNLLTFARFHQLERATAERRAAEMIERFRLADEAGRKVQDLSGGFRRRVQVAKTFMVETPVLFLDEFSTGMDPLLKREVMTMLREEARRGRTIVLTTQILSEAEELCEDILIVDHGRQVARGDLSTLKLLSQGVYEVSMTFDSMPAGIESELQNLPTLRARIENNTLDLAFKSPEGHVLELVSSLARNRRVLRLEMNGATLEDVFLELTETAPAAGRRKEAAE